MDLENLKESWRNTFYKTTVIYICILVTLIFGFQMYRYFITFPGGPVKCVTNVSSVLHSILWIGSWL